MSSYTSKEKAIPAFLEMRSLTAGASLFEFLHKLYTQTHASWTRNTNTNPWVESSGLSKM